MATALAAGVDRPHLGWWLAVVGGMAVLAGLAFDAAAYAWWCTHLTAVFPQRLLRTIFVAAVVTHLVEACYAARLAQRSGLGGAAAGWFVQTMILGYPSLGLLRARVARGRGRG